MSEVSSSCRRCGWVNADPLYLAYHDREWGVPVHDDRRLFEFLILEGAQAGLSWQTVLRKREHYRQALDNFDPVLIAQYPDSTIDVLMANPGLIRHRRKLAAIVQNARAFLAVQAEFGSFDAYLWQFVGGSPRQNTWPTLADVPTVTPESQAMSRDLKRRHFTFVGPTICYALMQACGLVNDHTIDCFRHPICAALVGADSVGVTPASPVPP